MYARGTAETTDVAVVEIASAVATPEGPART